MNTQKALTVTIVLIIIVIIALFGWATLRNASVPNTSNSNGSSSELPSGTGALASLLGTNADMKCAFTFDNPVLGKGDGVALITKEGNIRSDAVAVQNSTSVGLHVLNDSKFVYTWSGADNKTPLATILRLNTETTMDVMRDQPIPAIASVYTDVTYTCEPWTVEMTAFIPPPQIKFIDFALALQQIIEGVPVAQ